MKKSLIQKLTLNKITITNLEAKEQNQVKAGGTTKPNTICETCIEPSVCMACVTTVC